MEWAKHSRVKFILSHLASAWRLVLGRFPGLFPPVPGNECLGMNMLLGLLVEALLLPTLTSMVFSQYGGWVPKLAQRVRWKPVTLVAFLSSRASFSLFIKTASTHFKVSRNRCLSVWEKSKMVTEIWELIDYCGKFLNKQTKHILLQCCLQ